jgi:general secretion pathway protein K
VAILTAMLIVVLGTIIAVNLVWRQALDFRRFDSSIATDQGMLFLQGGEGWAGDILRQDLVDSPDSDNLGEQWATELPPLPMDVDGRNVGTITGKLEDLQGRFNLNNLIDQRGREDPLARRQFERLLVRLDLDPTLAGGVVDWLDPDTEQRFPDGGEDATYADTDPQYRTANAPITTPSELMAVARFDRKTYTALAPYITVLPFGTKVNVNTASAVVLSSLSDDIDLSMAESLVEERDGGKFLDIGATFSGLVEPDMLKRIDGVTQYFLLTATVTLGTNQLTMRSVLQRDASGLTREVFRNLGVE